jgi:hypothetical protein
LPSRERYREWRGGGSVGQVAHVGAVLCCIGAEVKTSTFGSQLRNIYSSMDNRFNNLVNNAKYGASYLQAMIEEEIDAEQDAIEAEDELIRASSPAHNRIDRLMENLAEASKEVVVPKTLKAYEV